MSRTTQAWIAFLSLGFFWTIESRAANAQEKEAAKEVVQTRQVISISLAVSSTGKETKRVVYAPPPGWYIRSHTIACTKRQGLASFTVTTVPAHWNSSSEESTGETAKGNVEAEGGVGPLKAGKAKVTGGKEHSMSEKQTQSFSHHALVVEAVAQGGGLLRSGASIELTVTAEMVPIRAEP